MKILDRYILTTYLKTFLSVFIILMFIFVLQAIWLYIGDLAGKDVATSVIVKLFLYITPTLIPLILPLTILLVSIMVFGQFAENYEFAAMKSTGISLQRAMRSLSLFIVFLAGVTFIFSNNVIPWANYNVYNLRKNIAKAQPAMAITEGQFNQIGEYNIKVEEKSGENGELLTDVLVHKKTPGKTENYTVIKSKTGKLVSSENSNILQFILYNGNYYDEIYSKDPKQRVKDPHARSAFEKYTINVDLESINQVDFEDKSYDNRYNMLDVNDLNYTIDSLNELKAVEIKNFAGTLYSRTSIEDLNENIKPVTDTLYKGELLDIFDTKSKIQLLNLASNTVNSTKQIIDAKTASYAVSTKWLNKHVISLHEKYVLAIACIILFFVGAPLGALIRKGGIGLPMVIAILLFLSYHFIGIFSKNSSQDGSFNPILATWLSTLIMLPLGIYLTQRATKDRGLFEMDAVLEPLKKLFKFKSKNHLTIINDKDYAFVTRFTDDKLVDTIKNYKSYNYNEGVKLIAYNTLIKRGVSVDAIEDKGVIIENNLKSQQKLAKDFNEYSKANLIAYAIGAILLVLFFVFRNNKLPQFATSSIELSIIAFLFFIVFYSVSIIVLKKFLNHIERDTKKLNWFLLVIGTPLYFATYFLLKNKVNDELQKSSIESIK